MRAALDARVFHGERLLRHGINYHARWLLLQRAAARGPRVGCRLWALFEDGIIEGVMRVGKLSQRHVFAGPAQALHIGSARHDRNIIVRCAVKETDGLLVLIRQSQSRNRVKFSSGHLCLTRWHIKTGKSQAGGAKNRYSKTDAHGWSLMCSQVHSISLSARFA